MSSSHSGAWVGGQVLVSAALMVTLFAAAGYIPVLGILVGLLTPTPLLLITLHRGRFTGWLALGLATLSLAQLLGSLQSVVFFAEYGVLGSIMAEAIRRQWSVEKTLLWSTIVPVLTTGIMMSQLFLSVDLDLGTVQRHFEEDLGQALRQLWVDEGRPSEEILRTYIQQTLETVIQLLPALFILSTAAAALLNYRVVTIVWRRLEGQPPLRQLSLAQWKAPEACVWVLIASGVCYFVPLPGMRIVGQNVLLLISFVYLFQGLGILTFYLNRTSKPPIFRTLAYIFLLIQPLLLLGVAVCGLFDLWFDFRRTGNKREELQ
jgi:uncharacterized protein YybS (DUF2232 family)